MTSYKIARRAFLRSAGASAVLLPLLKNIEASAQGHAGAVALHDSSPSAWNAAHWPGLADRAVASNRNLDDHHLHAAAEQRSFQPAQAQDGHDRRAQYRDRVAGAAGNSRRPEHSRGRRRRLVDGCTDAGATRHAGSRRRRTLDRPDLPRPISEPGRHVVAVDDDDAVPVSRAGSRHPLGPRRSGSARPVVYRPPLAQSIQDNLSRASRSFPRRSRSTSTTASSEASMSTGGNPSGAAAKLAQQQSALDFVSADLARLRTLVPASETTKLDSFATAIQQLESSLRMSLQPPTRVVRSLRCRRCSG